MGWTRYFLINVVNLCQQLSFKIGDKTDDLVKCINFFHQRRVVPTVAQLAARNTKLGAHSVHQCLLGIHVW